MSESVPAATNGVPEGVPGGMPGGVIERRATKAGELVLRRRGPDFEIVLDGMFLMSTACRASERALARLALECLGGDGLRVLVGGLGAGHTLAAVLADDRVAEAVVVELLPEVAAWAGTHLAATAGRALADPRARLVLGDVAEHLAASRGAYDAVLLDVDNGPSWTVRAENAALYQPTGLASALRALRMGGALALWSAQPEPALEAAVQATGRLLGRTLRLAAHAIATPLPDAADQRTAFDYVYVVTSASP